MNTATLVAPAGGWRQPDGLPVDWPHRESSRAIAVGGLLWHLQWLPAPDATSPLLVLLHGTGASVHSWAGVIDALRGKVPLLAIDLPGHGHTTGAAQDGLGFRAMATALEALLRALGVRGSVVVAGHSAGAPVALDWAGLQPPKACGSFAISAVVGLNPSLVPPPALYNRLLGPLLSPLATARPTASVLGRLAGSTALIDQLLHSTGTPLSPTQRQRYRELFARPDHVRGALGFMAAADLPALLQRCARPAVPFHCLVAEDDPWVRSQPLRRVLAEHFPRAVIRCERGGHLLHEAQPARAAAWLQDILETLSAGGQHQPPGFAGA